MARTPVQSTTHPGEWLYIRFEFSRNCRRGLPLTSAATYTWSFPECSCAWADLVTTGIWRAFDVPTLIYMYVCVSVCLSGGCAGGGFSWPSEEIWGVAIVVPSQLVSRITKQIKQQNNKQKIKLKNQKLKKKQKFKKKQIFCCAYANQLVKQ